MTKQKKSDKTKALNTGMHDTQIDGQIEGEVTFAADWGASEHIINKGLVLTDFRRCIGEVIRSANKNKTADTKIDDKGDLYLQSNVSENNFVKLTNVI